MLTSFIFKKAQFIQLIHIFFVNLIINVLIFMCFNFHANIFLFYLMKDDLRNCMLDNIIYILPISKRFIRHGLFTTLLKRRGFSILSTKIFRTLYSSYECPRLWIRKFSFILIPWMIYMTLLALVREFTHHRVNFYREDSPLIPLLWPSRLAHDLVFLKEFSTTHS